MKKILMQVLEFVGLSGIGWFLDFGTYMLLGFASSNVVLNNIISSWVGVTFVFIFATRRVFKNNSRISLKWKYLIYLLYQLVLIFLISKLLGVINTGIINHIDITLVVRISATISKILVTPITMVSNFLVLKGVIEKL